MPKLSTGLFLKLTVPLLIVIGGCSMTNRVSQLLKTPAPIVAATVAATPLPTATATPVPMAVLKVTILPTNTPEPRATASLTPAAKVSPTRKPTKTPTPTPKPNSFYLSDYRAKCADGAPKVSARVIDAAGEALPDVNVELLNGLATPVATMVTDGKGKASQEIGDEAGPGWIARVSDESGGGARARSVKVARSDLDCQPPYSADIELQKRDAGQRQMA